MAETYYERCAVVDALLAPLTLTTRAHNVLETLLLFHYREIRALTEVLALTDSQMLCLRGMGKKTLVEIREAIEKTAYDWVPVAVADNEHRPWLQGAAGHATGPHCTVDNP